MGGQNPRSTRVGPFGNSISFAPAPTPGLFCNKSNDDQENPNVKQSSTGENSGNSKIVYFQEQSLGT